jgi:uncharacterized protein (DUF362 family)
MNDARQAVTPCQKAQLDRRAMLVGGGAVVSGLLALPLVRGWLRPKADVFVARKQTYTGDLVRTIRDGLVATGLPFQRLAGRRVLLKPNLVEPTREAPHMTTHPAVILAAAEVFRGWGAEVSVGEAPGHVRDTEMALVESGVADALQQAKLPFADLNYEPSVWTRNGGRASKLAGMYFPRSVCEADLVVSLPKMKTHHWVGVTASMKNLYGTLPGIRYGWPKNVLHYAGIPQTVYDINASLPKTVAIVDGIECMEGDGPIMGTAKSMGLLVVGTNLPAVDATVCRLMRLDPRKVSYLALAADRLGPIAERQIQQRGERWEPLAQTFEILDKPHLRVMRETLCQAH